MSGKFKVILLVTTVILLVILGLFFPYRIGSIPEWRLRIVDQAGKPVGGAQVEQEWLDPAKDGQTMIESRDTDTHGWVTFPERPIHDQLANHSSNSKPSAHIYTCWQHPSGQVLYGQLFYEGKRSDLARQLILERGPVCPYS